MGHGERFVAIRSGPDSHASAVPRSSSPLITPPYLKRCTCMWSSLWEFLLCCASWALCCLLPRAQHVLAMERALREKRSTRAGTRGAMRGRRISQVCGIGFGPEEARVACR
jgi:hypothetical protein